MVLKAVGLRSSLEGVLEAFEEPFKESLKGPSTEPIKNPREDAPKPTSGGFGEVCLAAQPATEGSGALDRIGFL